MRKIHTIFIIWKNINIWIPFYVDIRITMWFKKETALPVTFYLHQRRSFHLFVLNFTYLYWNGKVILPPSLLQSSKKMETYNLRKRQTVSFQKVIYYYFNVKYTAKAIRVIPFFSITVWFQKGKCFDVLLFLRQKKFFSLFWKEWKTHSALFVSYSKDWKEREIYNLG